MPDCQSTIDDGKLKAVTPNKTSTTIPVVIVESHQHALEHVHAVLRKQKMLDKSWRMLHFDAHPDLACPSNAPAVACFTPRKCVVEEDENDLNNDEDDNSQQNDGKNLYELLDSTTSGIAEWILPLVLAGNLHSIEWVKPSFSSQFVVGTYQYAVGADMGESQASESTDTTETAPEIACFLDLSRHTKVKVDLCHPYYLDDDSFVPSNQLVLKQKLNLQVTELPLQDDDGTSTNALESSTCDQLWMLDICLDYFCCQNPYIQDIQNISPTAAQAFIGVMTAAKFHNASGSLPDDDEQGLEYQREVAAFHDQLRQTLLESHQSSSNEIEDVISNGSIGDFFEDPVQGETLVSNLLDTIHNDDKLLSMVLEAIPNWSMPHQSDHSDAASLFDQSLVKSLRLVEDAIQRRAAECGSRPPFVVTIARSSDDGFTPCDKVEFLQEEALAMLQRIFCESHNDKGCKNDDSGSNGEMSTCRLQLVRDYGEWEGSTI